MKIQNLHTLNFRFEKHLIFHLIFTKLSRRADLVDQTRRAVFCPSVPPGFALRASHFSWAARRRCRRRRAVSIPWGSWPIFGKLLANFRSFSAVSAPIFATKYAFCSIFQNPPDYWAEICEICQKLANFAAFAKNFMNFHEIC